MLDHQLIEGLIIAVGDQGLCLLIIEAACLLHQPQEGAPAVIEVSKPMLHFGGPEWMHVKADTLASAAIMIPLEDADLVESAPEIGAPKRFVLVELEAVLIVQVQRP